MKKEVNYHQRFKAINREMNNYELAFAEKPEIMAAKALFGSNNDKIGEILSQLLRPVSTVRSPKQDSENRMRKALWQMIGIGLTLATSQDNQPLLTTLKTYDAQRNRCSAYQLYEISLHVYDELSKVQELAAGNGLTEEKLAAFQQKVQEYVETLDSNGFQLSDRRKSRQELKTLIKANNHLLRFQLDTFVRFVEDEYLELFTNYMFLRKRKSSKSKPGTTIEEPAEIAGTVTDSVTGFPVANATINIVDFNLIATTDADGCYILDELEAGTYLIHCYAGNYLVPDAVSITADAGESLVVDFSLSPVVADAPAAA
jgi:hypothetical protein